MAISLSNKGRVAIKQQASWGTAQTSFAATDYLEIEAPFVPTLARETIRLNTFRPGFTEAEIIAGSKSPTELTFRFPMHGWSTSSSPTTDPTIFPDALLVKTVLGSASADAYTTALASGSSAASLNITNGSGDTAWQGYAQLIPHASGYDVGWIQTVDTTVTPDTETLLASIPHTPSSSGTLYGSLVAYLSTANQLPLTFDYLGSDSTAHIRFSDGLPTSVRINIAAKQVPMVEVTMRFLNWTNVGSGGAPTDATYGYPMLPATIGANGAYFQESNTEFCAATVTVTMTQELSEVECTGSSQGVSELVATNRNVTVEIIRTQSSLADLGLDNLQNTAGSIDNDPIQLNLATTPGRACSILIPAAVILEQPTLQDLGGKVATRLLLGCTPYTGDTGSTAPADTPFRIAWL